MHKVSVMMPAYNAELFIAQAIDSVLNQDYPNIQLVICDDASTDNTAKIILDYQRRFPNKILAYINESNIGVTKNCNKALSLCDGELIALFAGDDVMLPGKISAQVEKMSQNPDAVLCYHPVEIFDSLTDKTLFITDKTPKKNITSYRDILLKGGIPGGCSIMIRKNALPEGNYDVRLKTVSDWLFFIEIALTGRIVKLEETFARYRKHENGLSQKSLNLLDESLYALDLLLEKHPDNNELPPLVLQAKARYLAGESFRQLKADRKTAYDLSKRALFFSARIPYCGLFLITWLNLKCPRMQFLADFLINKGTYFLKRVIGS